MKKSILSFVVALVLFTACQKVVDADELLDTEEKVLITSYISPQDTVLRVNVTKALPAIGTPLSVRDFEGNLEKFLIKDATVLLSDEEGNETNLTYSDSLNTYLANASTLNILTNRDYFLKVVVDGQEFNASCTIPEKVTEINERVTMREGDFGGRDIDINLSFQDILGERNFYILGGLVTTTIKFEDEEEPQTFSFGLFFDTDEFLQDNLLDGDTLSGSAVNYIGRDANVLETKITLQVANVEEALFQNLRTASTNVDADGNPFVEYAIAPNTILDEGAVGVFAGYNLTEKTIELDL